MVSPRRDDTERQLDVDAAVIFPSLADLDGVTTMSQPVTLLVEEVYFDTADFDLAHHGLTLRRLTGADDAGWHLRLVEGDETRTVLRRPLGRATKAVPKDVRSPVRALVRDRQLAPVVRVSTRRLKYLLLGENATVLAHVSDDQVHTERLPDQAAPQERRQWAVELVDGGPALLEVAEQRLLGAGASPAPTASKLLRDPADLIPPAPPTPSRKELARGSAAQLVMTYLATHVAELHRQDIRLRTGEPDSVHKLRIAARRLRSALKTYRPLFEPRAADPVGDELRWLGQALSQARDAQVLRERLRHLVGGEPPELVLGPVMNRIDDELRTAERAGRELALQTLDGARYLRLLDALDGIVGPDAPLLPEADSPASDVLPRLLQRDAKRLRRAAHGIAHSETPQQHDAALHETRKKAKRLRYAAESTVPVLRGRAKKLAASAKRVQETLGEHQDTVMSRQQLREYGVRAHLSGENGFTFGRLHALEQMHAAAAERAFETAWSTIPRKNLRRWVRR